MTRFRFYIEKLEHNPLVNVLDPKPDTTYPGIIMYYKSIKDKQKNYIRGGAGRANFFFYQNLTLTLPSVNFSLTNLNTIRLKKTRPELTLTPFESGLDILPSLVWLARSNLFF